MDCAPLPDLDGLDREALLALIRAHDQQHASLIAAQDEQIRRLEAELDAQRQTVSEQAEELDSRSARIEHLKLMVEKFRHMQECFRKHPDIYGDGAFGMLPLFQTLLLMIPSL